MPVVRPIPGAAPLKNAGGIPTVFLPRTRPIPALGLLFALLLAAPAAASAEPLSPARQSELMGLLRQDCGSCHGLTLKGGLGPPLLPETLANKPVEFLAATIVQGRPGTPMPPWGPFLTQTEAEWLATRIKEGLQ